MERPRHSVQSQCMQENYLQSGKRKRLSWRHPMSAPAEEELTELLDPERELAMRSAAEPPTSYAMCLPVKYRRGRQSAKTLHPHYTLTARQSCRHAFIEAEELGPPQ